MDNTQTIQAMKNAMQRKGKEYKEAELIKDPVWHEASALVYKMKEGKAFKGSPEDLAKYGIDKMSEFNYNVSFGMVPDVMDIEKADMDTKIAFAYMMDTYDKKDATLEGFGRAVKELALDPTSYAGIGTLGAGFAMRKTGAELVKEGLKNRLMGGIKKYLKNEVAVGATEGALYTAGDNLARQKVYKESGMTSKISKKDIAISAGLGAVAGGGIVKGVKLAGKGIDMANKAGEEAMAVSAGGGTPPNIYQDIPIDNTRTRIGITKPRTPWTKERIKKELKGLYTSSSPKTFRNEIARFKDDKELEDHIFYHGTSSFATRLRPSISLKKGSFEGGGYGEQYWGISVSKDRNIASNFTGSSHYGRVMPVLLSKDAKIIDMPNISDSVELEDHIEELWRNNVDAVKIGDWNREFSEKELVILNPRAAVTGKPESFKVFQKKRFENLTPSEIIELHKQQETK